MGEGQEGESFAVLLNSRDWIGRPVIHKTRIGQWPFPLLREESKTRNVSPSVSIRSASRLCVFVVQSKTVGKDEA
jgi:hypothetical protein